MTIWLDTVLAVPVVGLLIRPKYEIIFNYPQILTSFLEEVSKNQGEITFTNSAMQEFKVETEAGFTYVFQPDNIIISYSYLLEAENLAGQLPTLERLEIKSYSNLLVDTIKQLKNVLSCFRGKNKLDVLRIGIVANISAAYDSVPPGVNLLIEYLAKPWGNSLIKCSATLTPILNDTTLVLERCHHTISFDKSTKPNELSLDLDWQQVPKGQNSWTTDMVEKQIDECRTKALEYFRVFEEGNLNYD